ncbi:MAG: four helix bundle protein [Saprospiraceae bacterium]
MKNENVIQLKSYALALRVIKAYQYLSVDKKEFILSKQLLRSGTSIGANVEEALGGLSERDFLFKLTIAHKESRETIYWLRLLKDTDYLSYEQAASLLKDSSEVRAILASIIKTTREKLER